MQTITEPSAPRKVELKQVDPRPCILVKAEKMKMEQVGGFLQKAYGQLYGYAASQTTPQQCFARYPSWEGNEFDVEAGVVVNQALPAKEGIEPGIFGGHTALFTLHKGPYKEVEGAYAALQAKMNELKLKPAGAPYEVYLNDPTEVPESELLTEVYWPAE